MSRKLLMAAAAAALGVSPFSVGVAQAGPLCSPQMAAAAPSIYQQCLQSEQNQALCGHASGCGGAVAASPAPQPAAPAPQPVVAAAPPPAAPEPVTPPRVGNNCSDPVYAAHYNLSCAGMNPQMVESTPYQNGTDLAHPSLKPGCTTSGCPNEPLAEPAPAPAPSAPPVQVAAADPPPPNVVYDGLIPTPYQQAPAPGWYDPLVSSPCNPINHSPTCVNENAPASYPGLALPPSQMLGAPAPEAAPPPEAPPPADAPPADAPPADAPPAPDALAAPPPEDPNAPQACTVSRVSHSSRVVLVGCMNGLLFPDSPGEAPLPPLTPLRPPAAEPPNNIPYTTPGGVPLRPPGVGGPGDQGGNIP